MTISERYREILNQLESQSDRFYEILPEDTAKALRLVDMAAEEMQDWVESVGEIPLMQMDSKLSPVLLKAHSQLDRARVMLNEAGHQEVVDSIWELEQLIYRLLNDL